MAEMSISRDDVLRLPASAIATAGDVNEGYQTYCYMLEGGSPRDLLLATSPRHIVSADDVAVVRAWGRSPVVQVLGRVDAGDWSPLTRTSSSEWIRSLSPASLSKGRHRLEVAATDKEGHQGHNAITFLVDSSGRYTAVPRVFPEVAATAFC